MDWQARRLVLYTPRFDELAVDLIGSGGAFPYLRETLSGSRLLHLMASLEHALGQAVADGAADRVVSLIAQGADPCHQVKILVTQRASSLRLLLHREMLQSLERAGFLSYKIPSCRMTLVLVFS